MRRRHEKESPSEAPIGLAMRQPASWASCAWGMLLPEEESQGKESKESRVIDGTCRGRGRRCTESSCAASFLALALRRNRVCLSRSLAGSLVGPSRGGVVGSPRGGRMISKHYTTAAAMMAGKGKPTGSKRGTRRREVHDPSCGLTWSGLAGDTRLERLPKCRAVAVAVMAKTECVP